MRIGIARFAAILLKMLNLLQYANISIKTHVIAAKNGLETEQGRRPTLPGEYLIEKTWVSRRGIFLSRNVYEKKGGN